MSHLVYIATSPSNKYYVGITNNFKRRLKEHGSSPYPFGRALRKYGKDNFTFQFVVCKDLEEALECEEFLVSEEEVKSRSYYNISHGGRPGIQMGKNNPMKDPRVVARHPAMWTSTFNPMKDPEIRRKLRPIHDSWKKPVHVMGKKYDGVRDAAKLLGWSRQKLTHRLKSKNYPDHYYL